MALKRKPITLLILTLILAVSMSISAFAAEADTAGNIFESGETISFSNIPFFAGAAFGKTIEVNQSEAKGSIMAVGESFNLEGTTIQESLYAGAGTINILDTRIVGNIFAAGKEITMNKQSYCNGIYAAAEEVVFEGTSNRLLVGGNKVVLSGMINGDAEIHAKEIEIAPEAVVTGKLNISSPEEPTIPEGAQIGDYEYEKISNTESSVISIGKNADIPKEEDSQVSNTEKIRKKVFKRIYWIVATVAIGLVLCWFFNEHLTRAGEYLKERTGSMIGCGIGGLLLTPLVIILLCLTIILAPLGGILLLIYILLLVTGTAFAGASLARLILPDMNVFLTALIGIVILGILKLIPGVGLIISIVANMYLIAYVIKYVWSKRLRRTKAY